MTDECIVGRTRNPARRGYGRLDGLVGVWEGGPEPSGLCAFIGIAEERPHRCGAKVERIHMGIGSWNRRILKCRALKLSGRGRQFKYCSQQSAWDLPVHMYSQCVPSGSITCREHSGRRPRTARVAQQPPDRQRCRIEDDAGSCPQA